MADKKGDDSLQARVRRRLEALSRSEQKVARYLSAHSQDIILSTANEIGRSTGTSDATVVRTVRALGYAGLPELKNEIGQDMISMVRPDHRLRRRIRVVGSDSQAILEHVFTESVERLHETERLLTPAEIERATEILLRAEYVLATGVGPSAAAASYLAIRLGRIGRKAHFTSRTGFGLADDLLQLRREDAVVAYARGRVYEDLRVIVEHARSVGASIILIAGDLTVGLDTHVDVTLRAVQSPSGLTGSPLTSLAVTDVLFLAVAARDENRATGASETLNSLRSALARGQP